MCVFMADPLTCEMGMGEFDIYTKRNTLLTKMGSAFPGVPGICLWHRSWALRKVSGMLASSGNEVAFLPMTSFDVKIRSPTLCVKGQTGLLISKWGLEFSLDYN